MADGHGNAVFPRGAIKRLKLVDFMSFVDTIVLEAGSRVNLVEGPNGSGKSSLVTAICVGLAGDMKALGRQTRVEELVRRGCVGFETEITLSGGMDQPDMVVQRRTEGKARGMKRRRGAGGSRGGTATLGDGEGIDEEASEDDDSGFSAGGRSGGQSGRTTWRIDGRMVTEKQVKEMSQSMGIHFDNLCMFLPQERVGEFTNMGSTELLESTEEAIGNGQLLQQHQELKRRSAQLKTKREELQRMHDRLSRVETDQAAHAAEYNRLQRRNKLRNELEQLRQKLTWLEKERHASELARASENAEFARGRVKEALQRLEQAKAPLNNRMRELQEMQRALMAKSQIERGLNGRVVGSLEALRRLEQHLRAMEEEFEGLKAKSDRWRAEVARCRQEVERVKAERVTLPQGLSPQQTARLAIVDLEIQQTAGETGSLEFQYSHKKQEIEQVTVQIRKLEEAGQRRHDLREQRLRKLERQLPLSRRLYEWIMEMRNAGRFRRRVLGPLLLEITAIPNQIWAAHLEFIVKINNLGAVVVEDQHDNNLVHDWLDSHKREVRGNINRILLLQNNPGPIQYTAGHPSRYAAYGITHTLDQVFEATSDLVKQALCISSGINTAYVGTERAEQGPVVNELLRQTTVRRILTPRVVNLVSTSEYDSTYITQKILPLPRAQLLDDRSADGNEEAERRQLEAMRQTKAVLEAQCQELSESIRQRHAAAHALQKEKIQLQDVRKRVEQSAMNLCRHETELARRTARLEQEGDPQGGADALRTALCNAAEDMMRQASSTAQLISEQHSLHRELAALELSLAAASASMAPLQQAVRSAEEDVRSSERKAVVTAQQIERAQERLRAGEARVREELGPLGGPDNAMRDAWMRWPDQTGEIKDLLASKQAEMELAQAALRGDEVAVMEAWRRRETEIADLRQQAAAGNDEAQKMKADMETRKAVWLPTLNSHMEAINETVKRHFAAIGCGGEVVLREAGDEFEKYAAEIRVQYRPHEPLRPLNRNHHSGGERSVATMLYLMALQGVTTTPFRVVDEINQGMDSCNERKVFNLLVKSSTRIDTPQCFLLTPKLIDGLHYNDHVRVLPLKCAPAAGLSMEPAVAEEVLAEAEKHDDVAAGGGSTGAVGAGASSSRCATAASGYRQPQPQQQHMVISAAARLGQLPWQQMKAMLFYGRAAMAKQA